MSRYDDRIDIHVRGATDTRFTSVSFHAQATTKDTTGPAAKKLLEPVISNILAAIKAHAAEANVDTGRLRTTLRTDVHHDRHSGQFIGYQATYTIDFQAKNVAHATKLHDALTSIKDVEASSPVFNIDDSPEIHARAFEQAVKKAKTKLDSQLKALGVDAVKLVTWTIQEEQPRGKTLSLHVDDSDFITPGIEPGHAIYEIGVTFHYVAETPTYHRAKS